MGDKKNIINKIKRVILIVEDEIINQEILKQILSREYEIIVASNGIEALDAIKAALKPISLILLDLHMPIMDGFSFLKEIKKDEKSSNIPIIVLTSDKGSEIDALELGAVDFIKKPYELPEIVLARVNKSIELSEDRIIVQELERDELTGVYNKTIFIEYEQKIDQYSNAEYRDTVVLNIEKFHLYNELYGRNKGDEALEAIADILKTIARDNDGIAGRLQSDYFVLYISHQENYQTLVDHIYNVLRDKYNINNIRFRLGVYRSTNEDGDINYRIDRAKLVCDEIRHSNKDTYSVYSKENENKALFKERLNQDFKKAVREKEFKVYYQPKISIEGDKFKLTSAEALIRWIHPELGFISPGMFIPLFEENGNIKILDRYVWNEAARQIKIWKDKYGITIPISVNVSRIDMFDESIVDTIESTALINDINPEDLYLEITESAYNNETDQIEGIIDSLREKGFKIEIDDFGSGYSSLNTLATLSFDVLKLDMKFVKDMFKNEKTLKMIGIVADIAKYLNVKLIAEGVENKEQLTKLKELNYHVVQGFYFSKAVPSEEFEQFFTKEFE